jgi:hypothetical protein
VVDVQSDDAVGAAREAQDPGDTQQVAGLDLGEQRVRDTWVAGFAGQKDSVAQFVWARGPLMCEGDLPGS